MAFFFGLIVGQAPTKIEAPRRPRAQTVGEDSEKKEAEERERKKREDAAADAAARKKKEEEEAERRRLEAEDARKRQEADEAARRNGIVRVNLFGGGQKALFSKKNLQLRNKLHGKRGRTKNSLRDWQSRNLRFVFDIFLKYYNIFFLFFFLG